MPAQTIERPTVVENQTTPKHAPKYRVLLHNDDGVSAELVCMGLMEVCQLSQTKAVEVMLTAHNTGIDLIKICDIEMAEFYVDGLKSKGVPSSMEPEE
jgi:ATP-dependent Clp protease adaptor protein ClpS